MLFNTIEFIIFFIIVLIGFVILKNRNFHHFFLLGVSFLFFYWSSNYLISLLIFSIILDFYVGKEIWKSKSIRRKKILLIFSLAGNLGLLGFFKYSDFAIAQFNILGNYINLTDSIPFLNLALPIGISFYTFQTISYTIDIYRGQLEPSKSIREFAIFVAFFPQIVAGPILRAKEFLPQLREKTEKLKTSKLRLIILTKSNLQIGATMIALGFFKKMFFADNIAPMVNEIFAMPVGLESFTIIWGTIGFGIQVYGDFSGYADIAIGIALIMGFKIPANFNKPFFATSPSEFWRRWHISLSTWIRDYLFFPIVFRKIGSDFVLISGILITFLLLGLWHGAGWNFIIFGLMHGIYVAFETFIRKRHPSFADNPLFRTRLGRIMSILFTQYLIFFTWIAFRVEDTDLMIYSMQKFLIWDFQIDNTIGFIRAHKFESGLICLFLILHFISFRLGNLIKRISSNNFYFFSFLTLVMISIFFFYDGNSEDFIYFKF
jgi:alginate O-acetyltransferase complex protein AlgI|tara:strand:+ start:1087 stop:2556 length:1470 start_codon:yes stop_codon:yes gene_type:complete